MSPFTSATSSRSYLIVIAVLMAFPTLAAAHLSIIRQGPESRGTIEAGDRHGETVAAGDFNGDGYEDLAMGAPFEALGGGLTNAGAVIVNWGSEFGITHEGSLLLTEDILGASNESEAEFGRALAAGDFNADGFDDLAIGVPGSSLGLGSPHVGKVYLLRGNDVTGLTSWLVLDQTQAGGFNELGDRFGSSLVVGNFDGDSRPAHDDLVVGGPGEDQFAGAVFYFMSNAAGPLGPSGWFKQSSFGGANSIGDSFGFSLAAGNLVGDGADDLAVGAPYKDVSAVDAGRVYLIPGSVGGGFLGSAAEYDASDVSSPGSGALFGLSLAAGHLMDANGWESLAIGEPNRTVLDIVNAGRVIIFPGGLFGLDRNGEALLYEYLVNGGLFTNDRFGWTLAAGYFDTPDSYEDLAIGSPFDGLGVTTNTGIVHVSYGGPNGPNQYGFGGFNQGTLNDPVEGLEELGASLAFGDFDGTNRGSLAAGAPGEDSQAGQVHVIAPWRQVYELQCRTSVSYDCNGNLIFSQKPFEEVSIASTTKIMTVLIACERSQLPPQDPRHVDLDTVYEIPSWVTRRVGGSQVPLFTDERISLRDLLFTCLMVSGNDAAYAIGDILVGQPGPTGIPTFVAEMNARATAIGMTRTSFHNAAGLDVELVGPPPAGGHYSTAEDMARLGMVAMANPIFRQIAETSYHTITRDLANPPRLLSWSCQNFVNWIVDNPQFPQGNGIKSGWTPNAQITTVVSAEVPLGGTSVASTFWTNRDTGNLLARQNAIDVLKLGLSECGFSPTIIAAENFEFYLEDASTLQGVITGGGVQYGGAMANDVTIDFCRQSGEAATSADVEIRRITELVLSYREREEYGIGPFEEHGEIRFLNMGTETAEFRVRFDHTTTPIDIVIGPGEVGTLPGYGGPDTLFRMTIEGMSRGAPIDITVEEEYRFSVAFPPGPCVGPALSAVFARSGRTVGDTFDIRVIGTDPNDGSMVFSRAHDGSVAADVHDPGLVDREAPAAPIRLRAATPNPLGSFGAGTRLGFDLSEGGVVRASIFDVAGRQVRGFPEMTLPRGNWFIEWDGRNNLGHAVPSGIYLYRMDLKGRDSVNGRVAVVR